MVLCPTTQTPGCFYLHTEPVFIFYLPCFSHAKLGLQLDGNLHKAMPSEYMHSYVHALLSCLTQMGPRGSWHAGTPMHHAAMANKKEMMFTLARLGCDWRARAEGIDGATAAFVLCGQHTRTTRQQVHCLSALSVIFMYIQRLWAQQGAGEVLHPVQCCRTVCNGTPSIKCYAM